MQQREQQRERGAVLILVAASLIVFMGMAGLVVDYGTTIELSKVSDP